MKVAAAATLFATAATATPVTFNYGGADNFFNQGLVGGGPWSGSITIDPDAATANNLSFPGSITNVTLNVGGHSFESINECTDVNCNSFSPVTLGSGTDAFVANYEGTFTSSTPFGSPSLTITDYLIDIRSAAELFTTNADAFDLLTPGQTVDLTVGPNSGSTFFQLGVTFAESTTALDNAIYNGADIDFLTATAESAAPIPLPAGAPLLLAGLGVLAWMRRRGS